MKKLKQIRKIQEDALFEKLSRIPIHSKEYIECMKILDRMSRII